MGQFVKVTSQNNHTFNLYVAQPRGTAKGAVVICPEIFGINSHIQSVADRYAEQGYAAFAPALFDRVEKDYVAGYEKADIEAGVAIMQKISLETAITDTAAAVEYARQSHAKVAVMGYCWGGTVAWRAAADISGISAAICYYPGGLAANADSQPKCPTMLHLGENDQSPPADKAREVLKGHPMAIAYFYEAGHGFNCDQRGSYHADSSAMATERSLAFLGLASARWMR